MGCSWALGTIYCLECVKELLRIISVCKLLDFTSLFAQPGVLQVFEPSLYCLTYVCIGSLTRYWYFWCKPCVFGVSLQEVPGFLCHSHQTNPGVCEILVRGNPLLKSERCFWRLSRSHLHLLNCVPVHLNDCRYHWRMLASCCLVSVWRHPISLALSCLVVVVQAECACWVCWQQACDLSNSLHHTPFCHSDSLPVLPLHYDIVNEMLFLRVGRRKTVLVISNACSAHFLKRRSPLLLHFPTPSDPITPSQVWWSVPTVALKSLRRMSLSVRGAAEITGSRSS